MRNKVESKKFKASLDSLSDIREYISIYAKRAGLRKDQSYKLCLSVDEIASNIINYGYPDSNIEADTIEIFISHKGNTFEVVLEDNSPAFNPLKYSGSFEKDVLLPLEERPVGGLGIMLAKQSVDTFSYEFKNGKNRNIFVVKIDN